MRIPPRVEYFFRPITAFVQKLIGFLFPKSNRVLVLESLTTSELLNTLPQAIGPDEENVFALFDYSHPLVKEIIWEVKYAGNTILTEKLGQILYDSVFQELEEQNVFAKHSTILLMPLPISGKRRFERGWNQAELLAKSVKKHDLTNSFKYMPGQLIKIIHTESQTKTGSKTERKQNLANSMQVVNPKSVQDKFVVLIDDVVTTGSTFAEARRALKSAGVKKILCVAVAH